MSFNYCLHSAGPLALIAVLLASQLSCQKAALAPANPRVAVLLFENQSDSPALNWATLLASEAVRQRLAADPQRSPVLLRSQEDVRQSGAALVLTGHMRRSAGQIRFEASLLDSATGARLEHFQSQGPETAQTAIQASEQFTKTLLGKAAKPFTGSPEAWKALTEASLEPSTEALNAVVTRFPDFGPAYLSLVEWLERSGKKQEADSILARLPAQLDPESVGRLALYASSNPASRIAALRQLAGLRQSDPALRLQLANLLQQSGDWKAAAVEYAALTRLEPTNGQGWNLLGYAYANQGQVKEAVQAMEQYAKLEPNEPNPLDSLGEVLYMNRKFAEAAKAFDQAAQRFPTLGAGIEWRKAAFAQFKAGDLKGADTRFENWLRLGLAQAPPPSLSFQRAAWLARTGRWLKQGRGLLEKDIASSNGEAKVAAELHLALLAFALEQKSPELAAFSRWAAAIKDPALRNTLSIFAFVTQSAKDPATIRAKAEAATARPELAALREALISAALSANRKKVPLSQPLEPLMNNIETPLSVFDIVAVP